MDDLIDGSCSDTVNNNYELCCQDNDNTTTTGYNNFNTYDTHTDDYTDDIGFNYFSHDYHQIDLTNSNLSNICQQKQSVSTIARKNLVIWDWDDTIFPTYSFRTHQDVKDKTFMPKLDILVGLVCKTFVQMIEIYGAENIIIVTNASPKWIHKCLNVDIVQDTFMPLQLLLQKHKITTISASKPSITRKYPSNCTKWKEVAFLELFENFFGFQTEETDFKSDNICNINCITSIGDSLSEYKASEYASNKIENRILNRIKLKANPCVNDMISQFKKILNIADKFRNNIDDIDLNFTHTSLVTDSDETC